MTAKQQQDLHNENEQEALAELIAIKVAEKYVLIMKEYVGKEITIHQFQCAAGKWGWCKSLLSAVTGGVAVGVIMWFITK